MSDPKKRGIRNVPKHVVSFLFFSLRRHFARCAFLVILHAHLFSKIISKNNNHLLSSIANIIILFSLKCKTENDIIFRTLKNASDTFTDIEK